MIRCRALRLSITLFVTATVSHGTLAKALDDGNSQAKPTSAPATPFARGAFYLRAGAVLDWPGGTRFGDRNCESTSPAALYGCGEGVDGAALGAAGDFDRTTGFTVGIGYIASSRVRVEAEVQYRPEFSFNGRANFTQTTGRQDVSAALSSISAILSVYAELPGRGLFNPFLGCGGGLSRNAIGETRMEFPRTTTVVPGASRVGFAWMLTAGVAARVREKMTVDVGWRYVNSGAVETGRATGRIVWRDGSRDPLELGLAETWANLSSHGLRVSLRYGL